MGLKDIVEKIIKDAEEEGEKKVKEAEKEAAEILKEAEKKSEELKKKIVKKAEKEAVEEKKRIIALARLEVRNKLLEKKKELIEEVFQEVSKRISSVSPDKYRNFLKKVILEATESGEEEVILNERDRELVDAKFLEEINKELQKNGKRGSLKLSSETREIEGGVILKKDGLEINASLETLLKELRSEKEKEILKKVLGGE
jgi:V/A-type H+-transporting ATPase subunit E